MSNNNTALMSSIKPRRKKLGLTLRSLSQMASITLTTLARAEKGDNTVRSFTLAMIDKALNDAENRNVEERDELWGLRSELSMTYVAERYLESKGQDTEPVLTCRKRICESIQALESQ